VIKSIQTKIAHLIRNFNQEIFFAHTKYLIYNSDRSELIRFDPAKRHKHQRQHPMVLFPNKQPSKTPTNKTKHR